MAHSSRPRPPRRATGALRAAGYYYVECCATCQHPGGLHTAWPLEKKGCRCCTDCKTYAPGDYAPWSDAMTREMTAGKGA